MAKKASNKNDLKKLSRLELLELLLEQTQRVEGLENELHETQARLENKQLDINEAGSIAEASLRLSGVFTSAQEAAQEYLDNIRQLSERQSSVCAEIEANARSKAETLIQQTQADCDQAMQMAEAIRAEAQLLSDGIDAEAQRIVEAAQAEAIQITDAAMAEAQRLTDAATTEAQRITDEATAEAQRITDEATAEAERITGEAKSKAEHSYESYWGTLSKRMETFYQQHPGLQQSLQSATARPAAADATPTMSDADAAQGETPAVPEAPAAADTDDAAPVRQYTDPREALKNAMARLQSLRKPAEAAPEAAEMASEFAPEAAFETTEQA